MLGMCMEVELGADRACDQCKPSALELRRTEGDQESMPRLHVPQACAAVAYSLGAWSCRERTCLMQPLCTKQKAFCLHHHCMQAENFAKTWSKATVSPSCAPP